MVPSVSPTSLAAFRLDLEALKYPDATEQKEGKLSVAGGADNATYLECVTAGGGGPLGKGKIQKLLARHKAHFPGFISLLRGSGCTP